MNTSENLSIKSKVLNEPLFEIKHLNGISRNQIYEWRKSGVLDDNRDDKSTNTWSLFSPVDVIWIGIAQQMKIFGFSRPQMTTCKKVIYTPIEAEDKNRYPALEYYLFQILTYDLPIFLVFNYNEIGIEKIWMLDDKDYFSKLSIGEIKNHTAILINDIIKNQLEPIYTSPNFSELAHLNNEELKALEIIRNKAYRHIRIKTLNGEISTIESTERLENIQHIQELILSGKYENFDVKAQNGKVVSAYKTTRKNFKK